MCYRVILDVGEFSLGDELHIVGRRSGIEFVVCDSALAIGVRLIVEHVHGAVVAEVEHKTVGFGDGGELD